MSEPLRTFTVTLTKSQLEQLESAWKKHPYALNRSDFIREAINAYAGMQIFPTKKYWQQWEQRVSGGVTK